MSSAAGVVGGLAANGTPNGTQLVLSGRFARCSVPVVMQVVGSKEFRPRLTQYLERARAGDEVVVLVNGHPAALLRPVRPDDVGALISSRVLRDELHKRLREARAGSLVVTWRGWMFAVLEAPPEGLEVMEDVS